MLKVQRFNLIVACLAGLFLVVGCGSAVEETVTGSTAGPSASEPATGSTTSTGGETGVFTSIGIDIDAPGYPHSVLVVVNTNPSSGADSEAAGSLPTPVAISRVLADGESFSGAPDLKLCGRGNHTDSELPHNYSGAFHQIRPAITVDTTSSTFTTSAGTILANKVYGTSTSNTLIFVEDGEEGADDWIAVGESFDANAYSNVLNMFGAPPDTDSNGKVVVLYSRFSAQHIAAGFAGYFDSLDLFENQTGSNGADMVHMNLYKRSSGDPVRWAPDQTLDTLAHELQHLVQYGYRHINHNFSVMDTWMSEGLAECAAHFGLNQPLTNSISYYKADPNGEFRNGLPLIKWFQTGADYVLTYMFFQYIRIHSTDGTSIYSEIMQSEGTDYQSIQTILVPQNSDFPTFKTALLNFTVANVLNGDSVYGYGSEKGTFDFGTPPAPTSVSSKSLDSGGALYIYTSGSTLTAFSPSGQGSDLSYIRVNKE
ncbi:MAG: hypothetical protein ACI9BD_000913 [Candidatus Marinamargulisbacteria bacterium]|jgi:hypothetical protein